MKPTVPGTKTTLPEGLVVRRPTRDDLPALVALWEACDLAEHGASEITLATLLPYWDAPGFSPADDAWVILSPEGRMVGMEWVDLPAGDAPIDLEGRVHPDYHDRGIGTYLLRLGEQRARQSCATSVNPSSLRVLTTVDSNNAKARALLQAEGYTPIRHYWRMEIRMDAPPPAPQWPAGIDVRIFAHGQDERTAYDVMQETFADVWGHVTPPFEEWVQTRMHDAHFDPTLWFLAMEGDQAVGAALCFPRQENGWVRGLGVRRPWRGRGIGLALLRHAFGEFYRRGRKAVALGVDAESLTGATRLYERAGMQVIRRFDAYSRHL